MTEEGSHSSIVTSSRGELILYDIWLNALCFMSNDFYDYVSDAASGWAHPEFGSSVNPITTSGTDYAHGPPYYC